MASSIFRVVELVETCKAINNPGKNDHTRKVSFNIFIRPRGGRKGLNLNLEGWGGGGGGVKRLKARM